MISRPPALGSGELSCHWNSLPALSARGAFKGNSLAGVLTRARLQYGWPARISTGYGSRVGNIPPAEAEANFYATLETKPMAAQLTEISLR